MYVNLHELPKSWNTTAQWAHKEWMLRPHQTTQKSDKNEDLTLPLLNVKDLDSSK